MKIVRATESLSVGIYGVGRRSAGCGEALTLSELPLRFSIKEIIFVPISTLFQEDRKISI